MNLFRSGFDVFPSLAPRYLQKLGLVQPDGAGGYVPTRSSIPLDRWLSMFEAVLAEIGPNALFKIGARIISHPYLPSSPRDLEAGLRYIDVAFHMSHRKGGLPMFDPGTNRMLEGIGHYVVNRLAGKKKIVVRCDTPYPCPLEHGIVSGIATQIEPRAVVEHDQPARCRSSGAEHCTYMVSW